MRTSPGSLAFNCDMLINVPLITNLAAIQDRRQHLVDENVRRVNIRRINYDYRVGQMVIVQE